MLVLNLNERSSVELAHALVARDHVAEAVHRMAVCQCEIGKLHAFFILSKPGPIAEIELVLRHILGWQANGKDLVVNRGCPRSRGKNAAKIVKLERIKQLE